MLSSLLLSPAPSPATTQPSTSTPPLLLLTSLGAGGSTFTTGDLDSGSSENSTAPSEFKALRDRRGTLFDTAAAAAPAPALPRLSFTLA
eukprot:CAMPEP_0197591796 /NCGR_PEP_ID=MMETSP1326-20131121/13922_1 /TAXON_ID=1155430 /ORGANISM="Genus nov. species nov., Strain RCC2288" /LENGTH=88 /DNA_ID=CAMNT_0043157355 /DNA_START=192 /DNA_END=454 /DNA_ORIENTATION=-